MEHITKEHAFVVSTCHVRYEDIQLLEDAKTYPHSVFKNEFTIILYVDPEMAADVNSINFITGKYPEEWTYNFSKEFIKILQIAHKHGCCWAILDKDGTVYDELPKFDW